MPTVKITKGALDALKPEPSEYIAWDQSTPGFGVKVTPRGSKSYVIQFRNGQNRTQRMTLGKTTAISLEKAREDARAKLQQARDGQDPRMEHLKRRTEPTVNDLINAWHGTYVKRYLRGIKEEMTPQQIDAYLRERVPSWKNTVCEIEQIRELWGKLVASVMSRPMLLNWHSSTHQIARPYAANYLVRRLSYVWDHAEKNDLLPATAASWRKLFDGFEYYSERPRDRVMTTDEVREFYHAIQYHREQGDLNAKHLTALELLLFTGMRHKEPLSLQWAKRDETTNYVMKASPDATSYVGGEIVLQRHKNWRKTGPKQIRITHVVAGLIERSREYRRVGANYLFPADKHQEKRTQVLDVYDAFQQVCKTARIEGVRPHDLRRTLISMGVEKGGVSVDAMAKAIGHADTDTTRKH